MMGIKFKFTFLNQTNTVVCSYDGASSYFFIFLLFLEKRKKKKKIVVMKMKQLVLEKECVVFREKVKG